MLIGVCKETHSLEKRVALTPVNVAALIKKGWTVLVEQGAGERSGHADEDYETSGARLVGDRETLFSEADVIVQVQTGGLDAEQGAIDLKLLPQGKILVGMMDPLANPEYGKTLADRGITSIAMELIPRITRAQSMDVLSSMAMISGYKSVIVGANACPKMFPMNMTAAGTLAPARAFVMGAGVAGLQACATARRLGAVVEAYDVRPAAREQILSVGAKPIELDIEAENTETQGGYAKEQSADFIARQQAAMADVLAEQDLVITTAAVPGKKSPILITEAQVKRMKRGAVIVDLAAEKGGNCELTQLGKTIVAHGVTIIGPENLPSTVASNSSQMYGKNIENLLAHIVDDHGCLSLDMDDEIVRETLVSHAGELINLRMRDLLGMPGLSEAPVSVQICSTAPGSQATPLNETALADDASIQKEN
jgi:NAD(P) transhydrogenase subunit alpha